jgi:hypothetical protein
MSTLSTLLTYNLTTKTLTDGGNAWNPPTYTFGESLCLALTFTQDSNGATLPVSPVVNALEAGLVFVDTPPAGGTVCLQIGSGSSTSANTTPAFPWNVGPVSLQILINALTAVTAAYGQCVVSPAQGSLLIKFPSFSGQPPLTVRNNLLYPVSFGTLNAWQVNAEWVQELRFMQAPLAYTSDSAPVLPPSPSVTEIQPGSTGYGATTDELQAVYVPPNFAGTYYLKFGEARTVALDVNDGATQIQAALQALAPDGGIFTVTNPQQYTAYVDFGGTMAGTPYSLLTVVVESAPPGNLTFTLDLGMGEMWAALRASSTGTVTVPLQISISAQDASGNPLPFIIYIPAITVQKSALFPELAEVPSINWLNPPSPLDYTPFDPSQVITGQQYYQAVVGNGAATSFAIAHGLATEVVFVFARQNVSNGRQLVDGTDFSVVINNANEVTVTVLTAAPALNAWAIYVMSAQTVAAFATGLVLTIGQVTGLAAALAAIGTELSAITALLPTAPPVVSPSSGGVINITLPAPALLFPGHVPSANSANAPTGKLPRAAALFPCINTAVSGIANGTFPLPAASSNAGVVVKNATGAAVTIDGGLGHDSWSLPNGGYVGCDGRQWFIVHQAGSTNSFFPADMERDLFEVPINSKMLVAGSTLSITFDVEFQLLQGNTRAQYFVMMELGTYPEDTSPSTVATNLQSVSWNTATPMLAQQVILTNVGVTHSFGVSVSLAADGTTFTAKTNLYGIWYGGATAPSSGNFAIRARLVQFDTEDGVTNAKGTVYCAVTNGTASIAT